MTGRGFVDVIARLGHAADAAELELAYNVLALERETAGDGPLGRALDLTLPVLYRELCRRAALEAAARVAPPKPNTYGPETVARARRELDA